MPAASRDPDRRTTATASRQAVVERAEAYVRANLGTPVLVSRLCQVLGISERSLRNAFYGVRGLSPKRSMLAMRLQGVRLALSEPPPEPITVTQIATGYGFYELGRFAAVYKNAFGEAPSATLYGRHGKSQQFSHRKAHADVGTGPWTNRRRSRRATDDWHAASGAAPRVEERRRTTRHCAS
jgi:AraC-like DNA-binding protein